MGWIEERQRLLGQPSTAPSQPARVPYPLPVRWSEPWRRFGAKIRRTDLLTSYEGLKSR